MVRARPAVRIGTSGWTYSSWRGKFYPVGLPASRFLEFYAREFSTTEVNYSFYHLPRPETYRKWASSTPEGFLFSVKASRFVSHVKKLQDASEPWSRFVASARALGERLGPILIQLPPSFRRDDERLAQFLDCAGEGLRLVFEFRHESWFHPEIYRLLERRGACLCIADSPRYPRADVVTAEFVYLRFHGRTRLFASSYSLSELSEEARRILSWRRHGLEVFAYFNNDAEGHAVDNARTLRELVEGSGRPSLRAAVRASRAKPRSDRDRTRAEAGPGSCGGSPGHCARR
jgi:uncharacterized protein YecE (DUF72 family)